MEASRAKVKALTMLIAFETRWSMSVEAKKSDDAIGHYLP